MLAKSRAPAPRRYFRELADAVDIPWDIALGGDLALPAVPGKRTVKIRLVNAYLARLHAAATADPDLARAFIRVVGLIDRPEGLLRPDRFLRTLLASPVTAATTAPATTTTPHPPAPVPRSTRHA